MEQEGYKIVEEFHTLYVGERNLGELRRAGVITRHECRVISGDASPNYVNSVRNNGLPSYKPHLVISLLLAGPLNCSRCSLTDQKGGLQRAPYPTAPTPCLAAKRDIAITSHRCLKPGNLFVLPPTNPTSYTPLIVPAQIPTTHHGRQER